MLADRRERKPPLLRLSDDRREPHPLSLIRHRDKLLPMSAPVHVDNVARLPTRHDEMLKTLSRLLGVGRGHGVTGLVEPEGRGPRWVTNPLAQTGPMELSTPP
jgi:hypothetical protein